MSNREREAKHSSAEKELYPRSKRWEDWLKTYEEAPDIDTRINQLHYGLRTNNRTAAIVFYLKEAEGHTCSNRNFFLADRDTNLISSQETLFGEFDSIDDARKQIAKTAFNQLMLHIFKDMRDKRYQETPSWLPYLCRPDILDATLHFFRIDESYAFLNLNTGESSPHLSTAQEFLTSLATYGWKRIPSGRYFDEEAGKLFASRREKLIDILCGLGQLDNLLRMDRIEETVLKKLEQLALKKEYWLYSVKKGREEFRKPANIDEAAFAGSQAARIAILLRKKFEVQAHFNAQADLRSKREEATAELERLSSAK